MKNKYKLLFAFATLGIVFHANFVNAKELSLTDIDKEIEENYAEAKDNIAYLYVIGDYAFSSEHKLTFNDIIYASSHSKHNIGSEIENSLIYYLQRTSDESDKWTGWTEGKSINGEGTLLKDGKFNISYIDGIDIEDRTEVNSDTNVKNYIKGVSGKTFFTKEYDEKNGVLTINLAKESLNFSGISGTNVVNELVNLIKLEGYESIDLTYGDTTVNITKDDDTAGEAVTKLNTLLSKVKEHQKITDVTIKVKFNLGEMYKEIGTHKSQYSIKFTSVVDVDAILEELAKDSSNKLSNNKLAMTLDGTTINVVVAHDNSDKTIASVSQSGIIDALTSLVTDARVKQITIANGKSVVVSNNSNGGTVKTQLASLLGVTKLNELAGKTLTVKVELNEGLGVLDTKAENTSETSRTYTIKFVNEVTQATNQAVSNVITNLCSGCTANYIEDENKNVIVVDIGTNGTTDLTDALTTLTSQITSAESYYKSIEVKLNGTTYTLKTGDSGKPAELINALKNLKLEGLKGKEVVIKYNLKDNNVDFYDSTSNIKNDDIKFNSNYTEYTIRVRHIVDTDDIVSKAVSNTSGSQVDSINMSLNKETHEINFELVKPKTSVNDLLKDKTISSFESKLNELKNGIYSSIVVDFNGTTYTIKGGEKASEELKTEFAKLMNAIGSKTLIELKDSKITVTFNLAEGTMDEVYGDTKSIEYTIKLSDKINIQETLEEAFQKYNEQLSTTKNKVVFNETDKLFYILYSDGTKTLDTLGNTIKTQLFDESGAFKKLLEDDRFAKIEFIIGDKTVTEIKNSQWGSDADGLKKEFDEAFKTLVNSLVKDSSITDGKNIKISELQNAVNNNDLLKIKVTLNETFAVTEEDGTTSYEYSIRMSKYTNTTVAMNSIKINAAQLSTSKFYESKHEIDFKVTSGNIEFNFENSGNNIYKSLNNSNFSSVVVSGRKTGTEKLTNLITLTKENTKSDSSGTHADTDNEILYAIKDLIGVEKDAKELKELIGYDIVITVNMGNGYLSENGNKVETYTIHFVA